MRGVTCLFCIVISRQATSLARLLQGLFLVQRQVAGRHRRISSGVTGRPRPDPIAIGYRCDEHGDTVRQLFHRDDRRRPIRWSQSASRKRFTCSPERVMRAKYEANANSKVPRPGGLLLPAARKRPDRKVATLLCVQREVAVAIAGRGSPSETHTLGLDCDWRLTKR